MERNVTTEQGDSTVLEVLREVASQWELDRLSDDIQSLTSDDAVQIGFLGDFSSGKSTLINELVGVEDLMPVQLEPCTARAGQVISTPSLQEPEYFRVDDEDEQTAISRPDFDDLARGHTPGRPLVRLPSRPGFPAGFVFLDTPGLSTPAFQEHTEVTLGKLPFVDAAMICVDIRKGGLTSTVTDFLTSPGVRHLQHRFLIALTFADQLPDSERAVVAEKTADTLAQTIGCAKSEAEGRIVVVSAGPEAAVRDVSTLRTAIHEVFEARKASLMAERQDRASVRLVPGAIATLEQMRGGLLESEGDFLSRQKEANDRRERLDQELHQQRQRFDKSRDDLRRDVSAICTDYKGRFAAASDDLAIEQFTYEDQLDHHQQPAKITIEQVSSAFISALATKVSEHFKRLGQERDNHVGEIDAEIKRLLKDTNKIMSVAATITTAALVAAILPGAGVAATAAESTVGAGLRHAAAKASTKMARRAAAEGLKKVGKSMLATMHDVNIINIVAVWVGERLKKERIDEPMDRICMEVSEQAARDIEAYFESEIFQPLKRESEEVQSVLSQIESDRRNDIKERNAKVSRIQDDIERLKKVGRP